MVPIIENEEKRRRVFKQSFNYNALQMTTKPALVSGNAHSANIVDDGLSPEVRQSMQGFIGMGHVKKQLSSYFNIFKLNEIRAQYGLVTTAVNTNMIFTGNPGTGKTTTARTVGNLLHQTGVLTKGHVVEVTPSDLLFSKTFGSEIQEMKKKIQEAKGGVLFIDEAHNFPEHAAKNSDPWRNAVNVLMQAMTSGKQDFSVIMAGYEDGMKNLLTLEPGLKRRCPNLVHFPDYNDKELALIFEQYANMTEYNLADGYQETLIRTIHETPHRLAKNFGNAGYAQNLFNETVKCVADRVARSTFVTLEDISTITAFDIKKADVKLNQPYYKNAIKHN
jgi:stage V sporulation protein K